jgi:hypothetical protein
MRRIREYAGTAVSAAEGDVPLLCAYHRIHMSRGAGYVRAGLRARIAYSPEKSQMFGVPLGREHLHQRRLPVGDDRRQVKWRIGIFAQQAGQPVTLGAEIP